MIGSFGAVCIALAALDVSFCSLEMGDGGDWIYNFPDPVNSLARSNSRIRDLLTYRPLGILLRFVSRRVASLLSRIYVYHIISCRK